MWLVRQKGRKEVQRCGSVFSPPRFSAPSSLRGRESTCPALPEVIKGLDMTASHNLPSGSDSKESAGNAGDRSLKPGSGRSLEKEMATTPVFLPGEFHRQSLVGWSMGSQRVVHDWATNTSASQRPLWRETPVWGLLYSLSCRDLPSPPHVWVSAALEATGHFLTTPPSTRLDPIVWPQFCPVIIWINNNSEHLLSIS